MEGQFVSVAITVTECQPTDALLAVYTDREPVTLFIVNSQELSAVTQGLLITVFVNTNAPHTLVPADESTESVATAVCVSYIGLPPSVCSKTDVDISVKG